MKRRIYVFLYIIIGFTFALAAGDTVYRTPIEGLNVHHKGSIVMLRHIKRGIKYNDWILYQVINETPSTLILKGIAIIKQGPETFVSKEVPADASITGLDTESPEFRGIYNTSLEKINAGCFNYRQMMMARSIIDWKEHPEEYDPDLAAKLSSDAFALTDCYEKLAGKRAYVQRLTRKEVEEKGKDSFGWMALLLAIPLLASIILGPTVSGGSINRNTWPKVKRIAIVETVGCILMPFGCAGIFSHWWVVILTILAIAAIQLYNIFFAWFLKDNLSEQAGRDFPFIIGLSYGILSFMVLYPVIMLIAVYCLPGIKVESSLSENLLGVLLGLALWVGASFWYRSWLEKRFPQAKGHFASIAILTLFGALGVLLLILFAIAFLIFKGIGRMALAQNEKDGGSTSIQRPTDPFKTCAHCARLGDSSCPNFNTEENPERTCSSWMPR